MLTGQTCPQRLFVQLGHNQPFRARGQVDDCSIQPATKHAAYQLRRSLQDGFQLQQRVFLMKYRFGSRELRRIDGGRHAQPERCVLGCVLSFSASGAVQHSATEVIRRGGYTAFLLDARAQGGRFV